MNITFPTDKLEDKKFDFTTEFGNFLIGGENTWHGGIHIEGKNVEIKAIADGRIIAYRLEDGYKSVVKNEGKDTEYLCKYSNCFMLIQHDFELVKQIVKNKGTKEESTEKKIENITFYSLYNHLLPLSSYTQESASRDVKLPDFLAKKEYQTGKDQKIKGLGVYKFEQNEKTKKFKKLKNTEVVLPYNTEFTLADDSIKENTIVVSYKRNGKTRTSTYKKIASFKDLNGENCADYYANVNSGISKKLTKTTYKATFKKDTSSIQGIPVHNNPSSNAPVIKVLESKKPLLTEAKAKNGFIAIKGTNEFVNLKHLTTVYTLDESKYTKNTIVACDIPVKRDKSIGYTGLKQSKVGGDDYYVCHHEIFMANDNEDTITNFLNDTFDIHSEEEKPLDKKQYYKLPKDVTLYKTLKVPNNPTIKAKTPVKVIAKKGKFCKVKILEKVERTVEKGALVVNNEKSKGKKIVYDIVNFDYISKIFDGTVSKKDTLIHIVDVKNTLVKVQYESKEKPREYDFWIPFSDLSKNYEFKTENKPTKVYKSIREEESITNYIINAIRPIEADNTRVSISKFIPNDKVVGPENKIEEVGRKNVTKKTYKEEIEEEKELIKLVPRSLLKNADTILLDYVNGANSKLKKRGVNTGYYPINPADTPSFNEINTIFEGKLDKVKMSPLFYTGKPLECNASGGKSGKLTHRRLACVYVYRETTVKNIVPNILHEDENLIQAVLPVEVYKKFEISESDYKILPIDNTGKDPKVHEDVDTLFAFFENKLPNVSGFVLKWKGPCNEKGEKLKSANNATHRIVEFNIAEFNEKQEVQNHILDRGYTPKVNDEVSLIKDVTDIWRAIPENKKDVDLILKKPTIVQLTKEKDIIVGEEKGDFHYRQVETHNLYLGNNPETKQKGWVKISDFEDDKFFSPFNWDQFDFTILDGGDEYIYEIKGTQGHTETKSEFVKKIWENFNILGPVIDADEVRFALGVNEVRYEMSRVVAKHQSEWSYSYDRIKADVVKFYDAQIELAKKNKREQEVIDDMENLKQEYLSSLQPQIKDLMFWNDAAATPYSPDVTEKKEEKKKTKLDFGNTDVDRQEFGTPTAVTTATTTTAPTETKKETPKTPERIFPDTENIYHFHPIAFINQMKLMFPDSGSSECYARERVKAFMTMLRVGEGTLNDIGYETIVGFTYFKDYGKDFSDHPNILNRKLNSTAAGAYQITMLNWKDSNFVNWRKKNGLTDFSHISQDKYCIYLLRNKRKVINLIIQGHICEAIHNMGQEWASLPKAGANQREEKMQDVVSYFIKYYNKELSGETMLHISNKELDEMIKGYDCKKGDFYDNSGEKEIIDLRDKVTFFDQGIGNANCNATCVLILNQLGLKPEFPNQISAKQPKLGKVASYYQLAEEDNTTKKLEVYEEDFVEGVKYLDKALEQGEPVMVGTDHTYMYVPKSVGHRINEYTTDHYVLIIGRNYKDGKVVYPYLDVGTQFGGKGDYYFTLESDRLISNSRKNKNYTITQIRRNGKIKK